MTNEQAYVYAAQWGHAHSGESGACMYGFNERFRVQSEQHRSACLDWIADCRRGVEEAPEDYDPDELEQLDALVAKLKEAQVEDR